jgi:hypothetical protein
VSIFLPSIGHIPGSHDLCVHPGARRTPSEPRCDLLAGVRSSRGTRRTRHLPVSCNGHRRLNSYPLPPEETWT